MEKAGDKSAQVGGEIAAEFIESARGYVTGIYLMPSFGRFETCTEIVRNLKRATSSGTIEKVARPGHKPRAPRP
jgi:hypothetical protein